MHHRKDKLYGIRYNFKALRKYEENVTESRVKRVGYG